jgi:glucuronokinase
MKLLRKQAFARAGLIGNPSDGYYGKTISAIVRNFRAQVTLYEWDDLEILWSEEDRTRFRSVYELVRDIKLHGYYGGVRLVKATIKKFVEFCASQGYALHNQNFAIRYESNIPRAVGLAGSSAIIIATLRALMDFYQVPIPQRVQPSLALAVERDELGIAAGLQDRVIQVYEGVVFMDFSRERIERLCGFECGVYEPLDPSLLPPLYLAYATDAGEPTEVVHNDLRERWRRGDPKVLAAMERFAELTVQFREALLARDWQTLGQLMDANFDLRESICQIAERHRQMVYTARKVGVPAKFAGSGGAIVGICPPEKWEELCRAMASIRCDVIRPQILPSPSGN